MKIGKVIAVVAVLVALLAVGPSRMSSMNDKYNSSSGRIYAWTEGLDMVKHNPLIGIGAGHWLHYHSLLAHNSYVQVMGESGFLGLLSWISMLYIFGKGLLTAWRQAEDAVVKRVAVGLAAALCGLLAAGYFLTTTQFDLYYIIFGMATSLLMSQKILETMNSRDWLNVGLLELALVASIYVTVRVFYTVS
jgi:O-antigen ligase